MISRFRPDNEISKTCLPQGCFLMDRVTSKPLVPGISESSGTTPGHNSPLSAAGPHGQMHILAPVCLAQVLLRLPNGGDVKRCTD